MNYILPLPRRHKKYVSEGNKEIDYIENESSDDLENHSAF